MCDICLSIVIPCYNVELYIRDCLNSILSQEIAHSLLQIICIDDGSNDNTKRILREYEEKFPNLLVLSQENKGASSARNYGLSYVKGNYVWFVDSDDMIAADCLKPLVQILTSNNNIELLPISFQYFSNKDSIPKIEKLTFEKKTFLDGLVATKIFRYDIIKKYGLAFSEEIKFGEDTLFTYMYYSHIHQVEFDKIREQIYIYRIREGSVTTTIDQQQNKIRRIDDIILQCRKFNEMISNQTIDAKRKVLTKKQNIEIEHLLYLMPEYPVDRKGIFKELKSAGLYPYRIMFDGIKERREKGYGIKTALSLLFFPCKLYYVIYYNIRHKVWIKSHIKT